VFGRTVSKIAGGREGRRGERAGRGGGSISGNDIGIVFRRSVSGMAGGWTCKWKGGKKK